MSANLRVIVLLFLIALVGVMWVMAFASKQQEKVASGVAALDPREFETLTLVSAGTGGTFENQWRRGPALVVGIGTDTVLIDAGRSVTESLRAANIPVHQPRTLLLSSLAPENLLGLDDLWLDAWLHGPESPLAIYGPVGTQAVVDGLMAALATPRQILVDGWEPLPVGGELRVTELSGGERLRIGPFEITSAAIPGAGSAALGWRIEAGDRIVAVAVAGSDAEAIAELGRGAHVLAVEGVYGASLDMAAESDLEFEGLDVLRREAAGHLRLEDVGAVATAAEAHSVLLTRLRPPPVFEFQYENLVAETFRRGPVFVAEDGEAVTP